MSSDTTRPTNVRLGSAEIVIVAACPMLTFDASLSVKPTFTSSCATSVSVMNPELELLELDDEDDALDALDADDVDAPALLDCCPTMPLIDATVPATGARRVVSSSFFCAVATCCSADVTAASLCASCSGFGACCLTATPATAELY